jgi:hypothetical protein
MWAGLWVGIYGENHRIYLKIMVGTTGLEPATSSVSRKRSNQLSYAPVHTMWAIKVGNGQNISLSALPPGAKCVRA